MSKGMMSAQAKEVKTQLKLFGGATKSHNGKLLKTPRNSSKDLRKPLKQPLIIVSEVKQNSMKGSLRKNEVSIETFKTPEVREKEDDLRYCWTVTVGNSPPCKVNEFNFLHGSLAEKRQKLNKNYNGNFHKGKIEKKNLVPGGDKNREDSSPVSLIEDSFSDFSGVIDQKPHVNARASVIIDKGKEKFSLRKIRLNSKSSVILSRLDKEDPKLGVRIDERI